MSGLDSGWAEQLGSLRAVAAAHGADTVVLRDPLNLSWFAGARWHVPQTLQASCFDLVISGLQDGPGDVRVVTNAIEAPRLRDTEFAGRDAVFDAVPWTEDRSTRLPEGPNVVADSPHGSSTVVSEDLAAARRVLTSRQRQQLTELSAGVRPGQTEQHVAGQLVAALLDEGIETVALFVGGDDRIARHRHPLATDRKIQERVMVACCGRRRGLVGTVTRVASFVPLGAAAADYRALLDVERRFLDLSRPGAVLGQVFAEGAAEYGRQGFDPDEWLRHHQGGLTGFSPRELIANPGTALELREGMALGWNPSGKGFKVEDTVLVTADGPRLLTIDPDWPTQHVGGRERPDVLVIH